MHVLRAWAALLACPLAALPLLLHCRIKCAARHVVETADANGMRLVLDRCVAVRAGGRLVRVGLVDVGVQRRDAEPHLRAHPAAARLLR